MSRLKSACHGPTHRARDRARVAGAVSRGVPRARVTAHGRVPRGACRGGRACHAPTRPRASGGVSRGVSRGRVTGRRRDDDGTAGAIVRASAGAIARVNRRRIDKKMKARALASGPSDIHFSGRFGRDWSVVTNGILTYEVYRVDGRQGWAQRLSLRAPLVHPRAHRAFDVCTTALG